MIERSQSPTYAERAGLTLGGTAIVAATYRFAVGNRIGHDRGARTLMPNRP